MDSETNVQQQTWDINREGFVLRKQSKPHIYSVHAK